VYCTNALFSRGGLVTAAVAPAGFGRRPPADRFQPAQPRLPRDGRVRSRAASATARCLCSRRRSTVTRKGVAVLARCSRLGTDADRAISRLCPRLSRATMGSITDFGALLSAATMAPRSSARFSPAIPSTRGSRGLRAEARCFIARVGRRQRQWRTRCGEEKTPAQIRKTRSNAPTRA
jgi:hypothetical protein